MKKAILMFTAPVVLAIITMLLCMLLFSSCDNNSNNENNEYSKSDRFVEIEHGRFNKDILYTTYKDGKPLLYDKDKEKE